MLYIASLVAAFIVPAPVPVIVQRQSAVQQATVLVADANPLLFPTSSSLAGGLIEAGKNVDTYAGKPTEMSLSEMLENIPASDLDLQGKEGMKRDQKGIENLQKRDAVAEERADAKYDAVMAKEDKQQ